MSPSGSVWIWVNGGGRNGDRLNVSFKDCRGAGVTTDSKRSILERRDEKERTDTEVGEDGMEAGERDMRTEFLFGDPREADGAV